MTQQIILILLYVFFVGLLTIISIFAFKKRILQIRLNYLNIILNVLLILFLGYRLLNMSGGVENPEKGIEFLVPLINIIMLFFANYNINKDEKLVKSVDRIR